MKSDFQDLLARLCSDIGFRAEFLADRSAVLSRFALSDSVQRALEQIDAIQLEEQAKTLIDKRWHEVRRLLPRTMATATDDIREYFEFHANRFWPVGHHRHLVDAWRFAEFLSKNGLAQVNPADKRTLRRTLQNS